MRPTYNVQELSNGRFAARVGGEIIAAADSRAELVSLMASRHRWDPPPEGDVIDGTAGLNDEQHPDGAAPSDAGDAGTSV